MEIVEKIEFLDLILNISWFGENMVMDYIVILWSQCEYSSERTKDCAFL